MAKENIEKTLIVFDEAEVRRMLEIARRNDPQEIWRFMLRVFIKKLESILRRRCG